MSSNGNDVLKMLESDGDTTGGVKEAAQFLRGGNDVEKISESFPTLVEEGITFSRTISLLPDGSSFDLQFDGQCQNEDAYGNNDCHYDWGDTIGAKYSIMVTEELDASATIQGKFKIDHFVPWEFLCKVCGEPCVLEIPIIQLERAIEMPPCPIVVGEMSDTVDEWIGNHSPTDGTIPTHIVGDVYVTDSSGIELIHATVNVFVK
eukprot:CAMPEP_0198288604 /NCGR_PEP_ID=MMETSP1449-20131203/7052_1 /TAXON_ID=420275 /ORGANISM="Attheya septentrionalis, Strain CCMP2084" /LENGTH=204 /DNA_ID=CAMNT_0043986773 /DNA_START=341 /DNA_END=955 /DNA_ORIENTATION=-